MLQEAVKLLLATGGVQVNAAAGDDMNALHFSAMKGHAEPAKLLIAAGGWGCPKPRSSSMSPHRFSVQMMNSWK